MLPGKDGTTEVDIAHSTEAVLIIKWTFLTHAATSDWQC